MNDRRRVFTFQIEYYRKSGKYYSDGEVNLEVKVLGGGKGFPHMTEAVNAIMALEKMPGLTGSGWDGPVRITCDEGYPCLVMEGIPRKGMNDVF